ncbi:hypothetical protein KDJ56_11415 [Brevibacillus composti]|uniref:Diacylglyceryl transferase n=1 Tax=Brevibacillus composti TaxID=2796470 RepID=A0A7T5JQQ8_9BACL|nr:hypothetical protein [Brevibacillus composti]QQE76425.1 hypothetical protein JD108_11470 [Brevibacillus composti]QUO43503.1 hypothetical protein KDJ56_11415 [Brevibacillus composti]
MLEPGTMLAFGPLHFSADLLSVLLALLLFPPWLKRVEADKSGSSAFLQAGGNSILLALVLYKLWPILEGGFEVIREPSRWLLYSGGAFGLEAGAAGGALLFFVQALRGKWLKPAVGEWLLAAVAFWALAQALLIKGYGIETAGWGLELQGVYYFPLHLLEAAVLLAMLLLLTFPRWRASFSKRERIGILLIGLGFWTIIHITLSAADRIPSGLLSYREEAGLVAVYLGAWLFLRKRE